MTSIASTMTPSRKLYAQHNDTVRAVTVAITDNTAVLKTVKRRLDNHE
jgi:hypothetical protein